MASPCSLSQTVAFNLPATSGKLYVNSWKLQLSYLQLIILRQMARQKNKIKSWNAIFGAMSTTFKMIGFNGSY